MTLSKAILKDVLRAAVPAMDDTTRAVVQNAQGKVRRRTGNLADSIDKEDAVLEGDEVSARWESPISTASSMR